MSLRPGNGFTGEVNEYMREIGMDRLRGWVAIYAQETGRILTYSSLRGVAPESLPTENLQGYLVFWKRWGHIYTTWVDGYDEYALIGKGERVLGKYLSDARFKEVQEVMHAEWDKRYTHGD